MFDHVRPGEAEWFVTGADDTIDAPFDDADPFPPPGGDLFAASTSVQPGSFLDEGDRGQGVENSKPSLDNNGAGAQLVRFGAFWGSGDGATVSYGFRSTAPSSMPSDTTGFTRFNSTQIVQTELALQAWADMANITFTRIGTGTSGESAYTNSATMLFGGYTDGRDGAAAFAFFPGSTGASANAGDSWYNVSLSYNASPTLGNYGRLTLAHEIGHNLGLGHPGDYNADPDVSLNYTTHAQYYEDSSQYSVMSYWNETHTGAQFFNNYAGGPLIDDIAAVQRLYGANMSTRADDSIYGFNSNTGRDYLSADSASDRLIFSVWDVDGFDTLDFSGFTGNQLINLTEGSFSNVGGLTGNISIALGVTIEAAIGGSGSDTIIAGNGTDSRSFADSYDDIPGSGSALSKSQFTDISTYAQAMSIDGTFNLAQNFAIQDSTLIPHTTINAVGGGNVDIYKFTITEVTSAWFDVDSTTASYDPYLYLYNENEELISFNDDSVIDPGSGKTQDSYLEYTFLENGTYYILVNTWDPDGFGSGVDNGASYTLHISFERAPDVVIDGYLGYELTGGGGNDLLISGIGADIMTGGSGADIFQIDNLHGADTITDFQAGIDMVDLSSLAEEVLITDGRSGRFVVFDEAITLQQVGNDTILAYEKTGKITSYTMDDALIIFENMNVNDLSLETDFLL